MNRRTRSVYRITTNKENTSQRHTRSLYEGGESSGGWSETSGPFRERSTRECDEETTCGSWDKTTLAERGRPSRWSSEKLFRVRNDEVVPVEPSLIYVWDDRSLIYVWDDGREEGYGNVYCQSPLVSGSLKRSTHTP